MDILAGIIAIILVLIVARFLGIFKGAPFVPTDRQTLERMIASAQIQPGDRLADLGSGDGRIVIAAAKAGAESHGYEINPLLVLWSRRKIKRANLANLAFIHWKSFWPQDFSEFNIITLFGITGIMPALEIKLKAELKPGSRVISNIFKFPNWQPEKNQNVYIYRK